MGEFDVSYTSGSNYEELADEQRKLDALQGKILQNAILPKAEQGRDIDAQVLETVFQGIDHFQEAIEGTEGDPALKEKYMGIIVQRMQRLSESTFGAEFTALVGETDKIIDTFLAQADLDEACLHLWNARETEMTDFRREMQGQKRYRVGSFFSLLSRYQSSQSDLFERYADRNLDHQELDAFLSNTFQKPLSHLDAALQIIRGSQTEETYAKGSSELASALSALSEVRVSERGNLLSGDLLLSQRMLEGWIRHNLHLVQLGHARFTAQTAIVEYWKNRDLGAFSKKLQASIALLKESRSHLIASGLISSGSNTFADKTADTSYEIHKLEEPIQSILENIPALQESSREIERAQILRAAEEAFTNFAEKRTGKLLGEQSREILEELGIEFTPSSGFEGGAIASLNAQQAQIQRVIKQLQQKAQESEARVAELESVTAQMVSANEQLAEEQARLRGAVVQSREEKSEGVREKNEAITIIGKRSEGLGLQQAFQELAEGSSESGVYDGKVDTLSGIQEFKGDISFGFDDVIRGETRDHFDIYPPLASQYYPAEMVSDFDPATSKGSLWQQREKRPYTNEGLSPTHTYVGKTSDRVTKLSLPQDFTVNTGSIRFSQDVPFNILKDDYGIVYLAIDNPSGEEIEFHVGIAFDDTKDDFWVHDQNKAQLTASLYTGSYSPETQSMMDEITGNPNVYRTGEDKANKVRTFIQSNYVYALDSSLNDRFSGYENQVEAIENTYVDYNGQQVHPAICNISARMAVSYLREMGVPAVVVTGDMKLSGDEYGRHAWIKYYDETDSKWKYMDPTPSRQWKPVQYEFSDPNAQQAYELFQQQQENEAKRQEFDAEKRATEQQTQQILVLQEEFQNEATVYENPQFLAYLLKGELQKAFESWQTEFDRLREKYDSETDPEIKKKIMAEEIQPFVLESLQNIQQVANESTSDEARSKKDLYRSYFENHLMILEEIMSAFPRIDWSDIESVIATYKTEYGQDTNENLHRILGDTGNGQRLVIMNDQLFLRNQAESFRSEPILDLSQYEEYRDFQKTPDEKHWAFMAKDTNGRYLIVKDGKEMKGRYEEVEEYTISANGDIYVIEKYISGHNDYGTPQHSCRAFFNDQYLGTGGLGTSIDFARKSEILVHLRNPGVDTPDTIFVNEREMLDKRGKPLQLADPAIIFLSDGSSLIQDKKGIIFNGDLVIDPESLYDFEGSLYIQHREVQGGVYLEFNYMGGQNPDKEQLKYFFISSDGQVSEATKIDWKNAKQPRTSSSNNSFGDTKPQKTDDGNYSYALSGTPLTTETGEAFTTPLPMKNSQMGEYVLLRFGKGGEMWHRMMMGKEMNMDEEMDWKEIERRMDQMQGKTYLVHRGSGKVQEMENGQDVAVSPDKSAGAFVTKAGGKEQVLHIQGEKVSPMPHQFESIEDVQVSDDGSQVGYCGIDGDNIFVVRNGEILQETQKPIGAVNNYCHLEFSDDFQHFALSKNYSTQPGGSSDQHLNYIDGVFVDTADNGVDHGVTGIFTGDSRRVKDGEVALPARGTLTSSAQGLLLFSPENPEETNRSLESIELRRVLQREEFFPEAFQLLNAVIRGQELDKNDKILLLQNYCANQTDLILKRKDDPFAFTARQYKELAQEDVAHYKTFLNTEKASSSPNQSKIQEAERLLGIAQEFVAKADQYYSSTSLSEFLENILLSSPNLLFDNRISEESKINGSIMLLRSAIENGDTSRVDQLTQRIEGENWKGRVAEKIQRFALFSGLGGMLPLQVEEKWRDVYRRLRGTEGVEH